jgi:L-cysteine S-thiosulfotransferase
VRRGERIILWSVAAVLAAGLARALMLKSGARDREIPFYSEAPSELARPAMDLYREYRCKDCHSLFTLRDLLQSVPAPMLDGIGSLRSRDWLFAYLSSPNPQQILPSRLKPQYRMPSYAGLPADQRSLLADYLASLKVKDWYLEETRRLEHEKLTGESTLPAAQSKLQK